MPGSVGASTATENYSSGRTLKKYLMRRVFFGETDGAGALSLELPSNGLDADVVFLFLAIFDNASSSIQSITAWVAS